MPNMTEKLVFRLHDLLKHDETLSPLHFAISEVSTGSGR